MTHDQRYSDAAAPPAAEARTARGARALVGVAIAIVGALAALNPDSALLRALSVAMPPLADAILTLITACGAILAAFSPPPTLARRKP